MSTINQKEEKTIEIQTEALEKYINKNNCELVKIFKDEGVSGALEDRPALAEMFDFLEDANNQDIDGVIIYRLDRLARGGRWYAGTVKHILNNRIYKGIAIYNGIKTINNDLPILLPPTGSNNK